MLDIAEANNDFYKYRIVIKQIIQRLNSKTGIITLDKLKEVAKFRNELSSYKFNSLEKFNYKMDIEFSKIYETIFKNRISFFDNLEKLVLMKSGDDFEKQFTLMDEIKDLIEKFDLFPGLSVSDFERIDQILKTYKI